MHLAFCIPELLFVLLLKVALTKIYLDHHVFTVSSLKIYLCCVAKFKSVLLKKSVTYVSAMCSYGWLASRT